MFDTHCHLNFSFFKNRVDQVVKDAKGAGVKYLLVPGTDIETSKKAVKLSQRYRGLYAAVGIHPHHVYKLKNQKLNIKNYITDIKQLLINNKVVGIGEIGLDKYCYQKTKYQNYTIDKNFFSLQKQFFFEQLKLAKKIKKSVIIHNRQAANDLIKLLNDNWDSFYTSRIVFHCCEPQKELLKFARDKKVFIGVDGDVTYSQKKQDFVRQVPLNLLVLETDAPFMVPEPLKSQKVFPNQPKNLGVIASFLSKLLGIKEGKLKEITLENGKELFNVIRISEI